MSTLTVSIEQVSYSMSRTSRSMSPTNIPSSNRGGSNLNSSSRYTKHEKSTESCLTATEGDLPRANMTSNYVTFGSTTGFWQKAPLVDVKLDFPCSQNFQTTVADTNSREMDEHGEETQSFAWANLQQFEW